MLPHWSMLCSQHTMELVRTLCFEAMFPKENHDTDLFMSLNLTVLTYTSSVNTRMLLFFPVGE